MKHLMVALAGLALVATPALGQWSDDFQAYAVGSQIVGQGGWEGWDGTAFPDAVVADDPAGVAGNKVLKLVTNNDIVHQYDFATSGTWVYTAKQYIPSTAQGPLETTFILMNNYTSGGDPKAWSLTIRADLLEDRSWDNNSGIAPGLITYDAWATIRVEIDLENNVRTTYYNDTKIGTAPWYDNSNANHAKKVAAVDLWADTGGNPVYYDDISLQPGTPGPIPDPTDITSNGLVVARYLVNLGQGFGDTVVTGQPLPSGVIEFSSAGGNQSPWWRINDRVAHEASQMVTFSGSNPDFFGYNFKLPATVTKVSWWNRTYLDGGTFAATPDLQYLDAPGGAWITITDVTWSDPYIVEYYHGGMRPYTITLNTPVQHAWGIRLIGNASETPMPNAGIIQGSTPQASYGNPPVDDDGAEISGAGFVGVSELTVYGHAELGTLDLSNNLALNAQPIANNWQGVTAPEIARVTDGLLDAANTTFGTVSPTGEDYIGVTWPAAKDNVAAVGMVFAGFRDGGFFGASCSELTAPRVEYTTDGTTWVPATGLDVGRYPMDFQGLRRLQWGPDAAYLFRFDPVDGITGIRIIGNPSGFIGGEGDGFVGVLEFEVFADSGAMVEAPAAAPLFRPSLVKLAGLRDRVVGHLRTAIGY